MNMNETVSIVKSQSEGFLLRTSEKTARMMGISKKKRAYVSFGAASCFVDVEILKGTDDNRISLSKDVIDSLHLPGYPEYETRVRKNEIAIGPCIGIMACRSSRDLTKKRLKELSLNVLCYNSIHGAIIAFPLDKVDTSKRIVEGYCHNPSSGGWEAGTFPYPLSIYRRTSIDEQWQNHFLSAIGDTVFNSYNFDKYTMYRWFSDEEGIAPHLPYTMIFKSSGDIFAMLGRYRTIYIKPIWGMKGHGVIRADIEEGKIVFRYREEGDNKSVSSDMKNKNETERIVGKLFKPGRHLIQQGLRLIRSGGGVVDFRCVMQKSDSSAWVCNGIVSRIGASESVVSNISSGGFAMPAEELLRSSLSLSEDRVFAMKERMIGLCMKVCAALDSYGINSGTLGLDIGVDQQGELWIIEVNNRSPHPAIALRVNDLQEYYTILSSPLYYAKSLAGFGR